MPASIQYKSLSCWVLEETNQHPSINDACGSDLSIVCSHHSSTEDNLLSFKISKFEGAMLTGHVYLKKIGNTFKYACQAAYLEDEAHCTQQIAWSSTFASYICESLAESEILSFLSMELEEEDNCAVAFRWISEHLSSPTSQQPRFLNIGYIKCSTRDDFLAFYSSAKEILNSVAVKDDIFICAYLAKTKKLLNSSRR